ncbi:uncharacterized protein LOC123311473 [Coccinella septempunctata]|uniref:uncharacterized protein LOC123311473 n=1 Tax=Coccinella septempunctata TaxID=41139 RepID=UPI001D097F7D|nr:uncharacterized protein LOC123311473 [Coccinella septempunctata]
MEKRNKPMSVEQKDILIEFICSHPEMKQKFSSTFSRQDSIALWKELTNILNGTPGAKKDWKEWRKSWHDIQSRAKTKKAQINAHSSKTGGGPAMVDLSEADERIVSIIGDTAIRGLLGVVEPQAQELVLEHDEKVESEQKQKDTNPHNAPLKKDILSSDNLGNVEAHAGKKIEKREILLRSVWIKLWNRILKQ